jgi:hypothetical protein
MGLGLQPDGRLLIVSMRGGRIAGSMAAALPRWELTVLPGTAHSSKRGLLQGRMTLWEKSSWI